MSKLYFARTRDLKYDHMVVSKTQNGAVKGLEKWWNKEYKTMNGKSFAEAANYYGFFLNSSVSSADSKSIKLDKAFDI